MIRPIMYIETHHTLNPKSYFRHGPLTNMQKEQDPDWSPAVTRRPSDAGMSNTEKRCILHIDKQPPSQKRKCQEVLPFDE